MTVLVPLVALIFLAPHLPPRFGGGMGVFLTFVSVVMLCVEAFS